MSYKFPTSMGGQDFDVVMEMLRRYNEGEIDLSDDQAEKLAELAYQMNAEFKPESKSIRKGLFDLVDTAAFGLIPNELRPYSIGEEMHGESKSDKIAGYLGTGAGLLTGVGGAYKLASNAPKVASAIGTGVGKVGQGLSSAGKTIKPALDKAYTQAQIRYGYAKPKIAKAYETAKSGGSSFLEYAGPRAKSAYNYAKERGAEAIAYGTPKLKHVVSKIKESDSIKRAANNVRNFYNGRRSSVILDQYGNPIR